MKPVTRRTEVLCNRKMFLSLVALGNLALAGAAAAQDTGISAQGNTGGLVIPSAWVLEPGALALTYGSYQEPQLGPYSKRQNYSVGLGLLPGVEVFGRFAEYQNPLAGSRDITGPRDLSANAKVQLPSFFAAQPKLALGVNDIGGGAVYFKSAYAVASDQYGPVRWSLGYAKGWPINGSAGNGYGFKGLFGGAELLLGKTGLSALVEHDGQQRHAGLRYYSPRLAALGDAQLVGTAQRSFGAADMQGREADRSSFALSLVIPLERGGARRAAYQPDAPSALPPLEAAAGETMKRTPEDRLEALQRALVATGLERVRVGTMGNDVVVEYENHRYGQNEADAIGIVLGLAAEFAPAGMRRAYAVTLKSGLRMYETSADIATYRRFLRDGQTANVRSSLAVDRSPRYGQADVRWITTAPSSHSRLRLEIQPSLAYTLGTEVGAFDHSLAADVQTLVPLWRGAELYTSTIQRLSQSQNYETGYPFAGSRQRNGLRVASLQQSFWLGRQVFANVGVGRFNYGGLGVQGEASMFVPGRDDVIRVRAGSFERAPGQSRRSTPASASYRYAHSDRTWIEAGMQRYTDGSWGPAVDFTRWFGDVGAQLVYRRGGDKHFAGVILSFPLTPRQGMAPRPVTVAGSSRFMTGVRTRLTVGTPTNSVEPGAVISFLPDYKSEVRQLNSGRVGETYFQAQLHRMREAFYLYGRDQVEK